MTGAERTRILDLAQAGDGMNLQMVYPEIVISTAFDAETGEKIFSPEDRTALLSKSANALDALATVGMRLSGFLAETSNDLGKGSSETVIEDSSSNQHKGWVGLSMNFFTAVRPITQSLQSNWRNGKRQNKYALGNKKKQTGGDAWLITI